MALLEWGADMAMIKLGEYLNETKYLDYAKNHVAFGFNNYTYFKEIP